MLIGKVRTCLGPTLTLYPGERAIAMLKEMRDSEQQVVGWEAAGWLIEPVPGWRAAWHRWKYRLWGRWFKAENCDGHVVFSIRPLPAIEINEK